MKTKYLLSLLAIILFLSNANSIWASGYQYSRGRLLYNNILNGAASGTLIGLSAGLMGYGMEDNTDSELILIGPIYGALGGALLGAGIGLYQFTTPVSSTPYPLMEYIAGGTGVGMLMGAMVATIAYARYDDRNFNTEIGLGGLIGAALGLGLVVLEFSAPSSGGDDLLSGKIGLSPEMAGLPHMVPKLKREPIFGCRLAKINF
ncbi:hypothetical protein KAR10_06115 [bacterium]|nr:hypothetical protein [bacterium]